MMEFLQPALLWGTLAIAIPIALHLWHQKKGKPLAWAATQFLFEKSQQPQRGFRLDQILLLLLRCLILILLALLLSDPVLNALKQAGFLPKIHLVQPDEFVVNNYRFELEEARKKGESILWLTAPLRPADELTLPRTFPEAFPAGLIQNAINQVAKEPVDVNLYVRNERRTLSQLPFILTPTDFHLYAATDTLGQVARPYWGLAQDKKLYLDAQNRLRDDGGEASLAGQPLGKGPLSARIALKNPLERTTVEAALRAFVEVYGWELELDEGPREASVRVPQVLVTDQVPAVAAPNTLYMVTGQGGWSAIPNVVYVPEMLTPQTSPLVANGRLPEWLGQQIVHHVGMEGNADPLTATELRTLFQPTAHPTGNPSAETQRLLFVVLLATIILERSLSLLRNV